MPNENISNLYNSLINYGGGSYSITNGVLNPTKGFMVAVQGKEMIIDMPANSEEFRTALIEYFRSYYHELFEQPNNYLGVWINPDNGKVYIDISEQVMNYHEAMCLGRERAQIAIFDNEKAEVINVKYAYVETISASNIHTIKTV